MGLTKFIIRVGATGSTARWVAKHYLRLKSDNLNIKEVMKEIIDFRYQHINLKQAKEPLTERLAYLDNLTDFTFSILQLEGAIKTTEMDMSLQMEVTEVIMEELRKKGMSDKEILGENIY